MQTNEHQVGTRPVCANIVLWEIDLSVVGTGYYLVGSRLIFNIHKVHLEGREKKICLSAVGAFESYCIVSQIFWDLQVSVCVKLVSESAKEKYFSFLFFEFR